MSRDARLARARVLQGTRAGFVSRILALVLDTGVVFLLQTAILASAALVRWLVTAGGFQVGPPRGAGAVVLPVAVAVIYLGQFWATTGRTLGEQVLGLRTLTEAGWRLGSLRSYLRAALTVALPAGILWVLVSRKNASVQDLLCRTTVVYDWAYHPPVT